MNVKMPFIALTLLTITACEEPKDKTGKTLDTPTTGSIKIMADEGYRPIIETSIDVFDSIYRRAKIEPLYVSEGTAINNLIRDSVQVIVITRKLTEKELSYFLKRGFSPPTTAVAHDALAFIVHPKYRDTLFTIEQIKGILNGEITSWKQLNPASPLRELQIVFDNPLSYTVRYAKDSIALGSSLSPRASALETNEKVIEYVSKNKNARGVIAANWISDTDDRGVQAFRKEIKIADIAKKSGAAGYGP